MIHFASVFCKYNNKNEKTSQASVDEQIDIYCKEIISHGRLAVPRYLASLISVMLHCRAAESAARWRCLLYADKSSTFSQPDER